MYQYHGIEILTFEDTDLYTGMDWASDGEEGEDQYSIKPGYSDI